MRRLLAFLLVFALCMGMCGCESKSEAVKQTEAMIEAIGTVDVSSRDAILEARSLYETLSPEEQAAVGNFETLTAAQETYDGFFETVEITNANWQDYFVAEAPLFWGEDAFGDAESISVPLLVRVKDDYANRILWDSSRMSVTYNEDVWQGSCMVDWDARSLELEDRGLHKGSKLCVWENGQDRHFSNYIDQFREAYVDGNVLFYAFSEWPELLKIVEGKGRQFVNLSYYTIVEMSGHITVLKPEYEPIEFAAKVDEKNAEVEGYTPVELTMDNWQDYLELRYEEDWHFDESLQQTVYSEKCYLHVKEEWQDKVSYLHGTNVQIKTEQENIKVLYTADWENHVFTIGKQLGTYTEKNSAVREYGENKGVSFGEGGRLMHVANRVYFSLDQTNDGQYRPAVDRKTGKPYAYCAEKVDVIRIAGELYLADE